MDISGYVLLDESWREYDLDMEHEFLMLSDANYFSNWGRPHENHPYKKSYDFIDFIEYHVMMVTRPEEGIVERLGLGRVLHEAVKDAYGDGPVWKEVILG